MAAAVKPSPPALALALATVAVLSSLPAAQAALADNVEFSESDYLRIAAGDIPRTPAVEPEGRWNLVEYQRVTNTGGSWSQALFTLPAGAALDAADCTCGNVTAERVADGRLAIRFPPSAPAGPHVVAVRSHRAAGEFAFTHAPPASGGWAAAFYVKPGQEVASNVAAAVAGLPSTAENPGYEIWQFGSASHAEAWFAVRAVPAATLPALSAAGPDWVLLGVAFAAGALLWAALVARGLAQKRSRKQVAATAAHVEAAAADPPAVLEGKKRALLAALKEVELARQANELPVDVYDAVKADLKRQTVTVMRALEAAGPPKA